VVWVLRLTVSMLAVTVAAGAVPMAEKEFLPTGVQLIEAGYGGRVADLAAAPVQGIVVAVVDTGKLYGPGGGCWLHPLGYAVPHCPSWALRGIKHS
jgi:hypothetical protein